MYGNICFEKNMENFPNNLTCDCPVECNFISYSMSVESTPLDAKELCSKDIEDASIMKPFIENKFPPKFVRKLMKVKYNVSDDQIEYCKKNLQFRAEVIFKLATDSMPVTIISRRLSFFDKMSAFGKLNKKPILI